MTSSRIARLSLLALLLGASPARSGELAGFALKSAGVDAGLCLVVGETDGKLSAALAGGSRLYVQGCAGDQKAVQGARKALVEAGVTDRASVVWREADHLPYADNLVNLLVAPRWGAGSVEVEEVVRVLAPGGTALLGNDANPGAVSGLEAKLKKVGIEKVENLSRKGWIKFVKPVNPDLGDWTHIRAGADQSYVGEDTVVAPWKEVRWIGDPRWGALYSSYGGLVTTGGRLYYKENRRAGGGSQWNLVGRDAYNGFELWRVASGPVVRKVMQPTDFTLCCDESRVYLMEDGALVARDGASGEKVQEYAPGFAPKVVTSAGRFLLASARTSAACLDKQSGKVLWKKPCRGHPASDGKTAFLVEGDTLEALDLLTGAPKWKGKITGMPAEVSQAFTVEVKCKGSAVYVVAQERYKPVGIVSAHDAGSGKQLWKRDGKFTHGVLPFEDEVWCMDRDNKNKVDNMAALVLDPRTGKEKHKFQVKGSVMSKCWVARASADFIMYSNGWYLERETNTSSATKTTRSPCRLGQHPANGLTYFMPHHCDCKVTLRGFLALSRPGKRKWFNDAEGQGAARLFKSGGGASGAQEKPDDWPTYRRDIKRTNSAAGALPGALKELWSVKVGNGALTQATTAYGLVYAAERRSHRVVALDAAGGEERWSFVADGRVEYPPTLHNGMCLFGTGAGSVYCLDAKSGREIWRLRAAPAQKFIADRGKFDSPWPVSGSVLVLDGVAYFSVGHSSSQSGGGLWYYAVDPASGAVKWRKQGLGAGDMFTSDGKLLFHALKPYAPATGEKVNGVHKMTGVLHTTRYLGAVSVVDYMATLEPNLSHKKHIELTDGRIEGDCLAFNEKLSVAGWRYTPGVPNWKDKDKTNKWFMHALGAAEWNLHDIKQHIMAIVLAGDKVYAAGRPTSYDPKDKSELWILSAADGKNLQTIGIEGIPVYDGLSASGGRLYLATEDGRLVCYGAK